MITIDIGGTKISFTSRKIRRYFEKEGIELIKDELYFVETKRVNLYDFMNICNDYNELKK